jgi:hypothetical protein
VGVGRQSLSFGTLAAGRSDRASRAISQTGRVDPRARGGGTGSHEDSERDVTSRPAGASPSGAPPPHRLDRLVWVGSGIDITEQNPCCPGGVRRPARPRSSCMSCVRARPGGPGLSPTGAPRARRWLALSQLDRPTHTGRWRAQRRSACLRSDDEGRQAGKRTGLCCPAGSAPDGRTTPPGRFPTAVGRTRLPAH